MGWALFGIRAEIAEKKNAHAETRRRGDVAFAAKRLCPFGTAVWRSVDRKGGPVGPDPLRVSASPRESNPLRSLREMRMARWPAAGIRPCRDRKSTRLNSRH